MLESSGDGGMSPGGRVGGRDGGMRPWGPGGGGGLPIDGALEEVSTPDGDQLEKAAKLGQINTVNGAFWRPGHWDPTLRAMPILAVFARSGWEAINVPAPNNHEAALAGEISQLLDLVYMREDRMAELVAQSGEPARYWSQLYSMTPQSHPATWTVLSGAMAVAHMVGMHWKSIHNRARPPQIYPALMPPIPVPPHPSYPSGHALHARLIEQALVAVCPAMEAASRELAQRLSVNRHIAGVHFPSDTRASEALAAGLASRLMAALDTVIWNGEPSPLAAAKAEWNAQPGQMPKPAPPLGPVVAPAGPPQA